jgi:hypothetical protein
VLFGTTAATGLVVVNDTTITAVGPRGVGTVDVTVVGSAACGNGIQTSAFRYVAAGLAFTGAVFVPTIVVALLLLLSGLALALTRVRRRDGLIES